VAMWPLFGMTCVIQVPFDSVAIYHDFDTSKRHFACPRIMAAPYWHCSPGYHNVLDRCCMAFHRRHVVYTATRALVDAGTL
jgi:hypothetical protein